MTNLGTLPGFLFSSAFEVNDRGVVVGRLWAGAGNVGFIWYDGVMVDLNRLVPPEAGLEIIIASSISNQGKILCRAIKAGDSVGVILTPIQAPLGDLTCDGMVFLDDFELLLKSWGPCPSEGGCPADLDGDGAVGIVDFLILLGHWG